MDSLNQICSKATTSLIENVRILMSVIFEDCDLKTVVNNIDL